MIRIGELLSAVRTLEATSVAARFVVGFLAPGLSCTAPIVAGGVARGNNPGTINYLGLDTPNTSWQHAGRWSGP